MSLIWEFAALSYLSVYSIIIAIVYYKNDLLYSYYIDIKYINMNLHSFLNVSWLLISRTISYCIVHYQNWQNERWQNSATFPLSQIFFVAATFIWVVKSFSRNHKTHKTRWFVQKVNVMLVLCKYCNWKLNIRLTFNCLVKYLKITCHNFCNIRQFGRVLNCWSQIDVK